MKRKGFTVGFQLMAGISLLVLTPIVILYLVTTSIVSSEALKQQDAQLRNQTLTTYISIGARFDQLMQKVDSDLQFARYVLDSGGAVSLAPGAAEVEGKNQISGKTESIRLPTMTIGGLPILNDFGIVDEIKGRVGGTATVFQMIPQGMLRVSTNVLTLDGKRAVGTYIPVESEVYRTVMEGETYHGRAYVVNAWYITAYEPLRDRSGKIIGALYVGVKEGEIQNVILNELADIKIGTSGYIYVLNSKGDYILSQGRQRDGENIMDSRDSKGNSFVREMVTAGTALKGRETGIQHYPWKNPEDSRPRNKISVFTYFAPWDWIIAISSYEDEVLAAATGTQQAILLIAIGFALFSILISLLITRTFVKPLRSFGTALSGIAAGNLVDKVSVASSTREFMELRQTLEDALLSNLRGILQGVRSTSESGTRLSSELNADTESTAKSMGEISSTAERMQQELGSLAVRMKGAEDAVTEIDSGIATLDERIEGQTSAITQSSAAIEEMAASLHSVADIASRERDSSNDLLGRIHEGGETVRAMGADVSDVAAKFADIQELLSVIESIASSTNLLAMNAAIEAAHAGDAGKGFAVVADEIRKLAMSTSENAQGIAAGINEMMALIGRTSASSRASGEVLSAISDSTQKFVQAFDEIAQATIEVSKGSEQTLAGVSELRNSAQVIKETSSGIQSNSNRIRTLVESIREAIDHAVGDFGDMQQGFASISEAQREVQRLTGENASLMDRLTEQIDFFRLGDSADLRRSRL